IAPVQTDKTAESIAEIQKEAQDVIGNKPLTQEEVDKIKQQMIRSLPGSYETSGAVLDAVESIVRYERPDNYIQTLKPRLEAIEPASVERAIKRIINPNAMTWVIIGDLSTIEAPIRALKLADVQVLDNDGNSVSTH
ncbi:MAG TPA: insulinase family protein, partial [Xylella fastidiosa subsp. pauca]